MCRFNMLMNEAKMVINESTTAKDFKTQYVCFNKLYAIARMLENELYYARNALEDSAQNTISIDAYVQVKACKQAFRTVMKQAHRCYATAMNVLEDLDIDTLDCFSCIESYLLTDMFNKLRELN